jgi:outer membrane protein TolC
LRAEESNRLRLESGSYEWSLRIGGQRRRVSPATGPDERYNEWNAAVERPLRLPGKGALDAEIGAAGVALAETARGDALHEHSRQLLAAWFAVLKESVANRQWQEQVQLLRKQAEGVQRRVQLGDAARVDAIQADGALAQAEVQLAQADSRERIARENLHRFFPGLPEPEVKAIGEPQAPAGSEEEWIAAILEHSHELGMATGETRRARTLAERASRDRLPDPTVGLQVSRERAGEEQILGAYISIPLPGGARRAGSDMAAAQAMAAQDRENAVRRRIGAEASALYRSAVFAVTGWQSGERAARQMEQAAEMNTRAYQFGEGSLNELLLSRRLANEARLNARQLQLDALEFGYRLQLDAHRLWDLD